MDKATLAAIQAPLKATYLDHRTEAVVTLSAVATSMELEVRASIGRAG